GHQRAHFALAGGELVRGRFGRRSVDELLVQVAVDERFTLPGRDDAAHDGLGGRATVEVAAHAELAGQTDRVDGGGVEVHHDRGVGVDLPQLLLDLREVASVGVEIEHDDVGL